MPVRAAARKAVLAADPASAKNRHDKARGGRFIGPPCPEPTGMASGVIRMPAEDLAAFWTAIDAAARRARTDDPDDPRTLDQLRADTLAQLCWSALEIGHLGCCNPTCGHVHQPFGTRHGRAATVNVTVPITTLLGLDDQPAHLHGHGPITAETARRLGADGTWRRLLTDPATGALLDYGTTRYTPPADLVDHITARDRSCRFPTCTHPAESCDFDHTIPAADGGPPAPPTAHHYTAVTISTKPTTAGDSTNPNPANSSGPSTPATPTKSTPKSSDPSSPTTATRPRTAGADAAGIRPGPTTTLLMALQVQALAPYLTCPLPRGGAAWRPTARLAMTRTHGNGDVGEHSETQTDASREQDRRVDVSSVRRTTGEWE